LFCGAETFLLKTKKKSTKRQSKLFYYIEQKHKQQTQNYLQLRWIFGKDQQGNMNETFPYGTTRAITDVWKIILVVTEENDYDGLDM
jgi:uncharacterized protein (DUF2225 family)